MILIVTHSADAGADLVIRHLLARQANYLRVDTDQLGTPNRHFGFEGGEPRLVYGSKSLPCHQVSAVWVRRLARPKSIEFVVPEYKSFTMRELYQVMEAYLDSVGGLSVNSYEADRRAGNRLYQATIAKSVGFLIPDTLVTQQKQKAEEFVLSRQAISKAISFGSLTEQGSEVVHTSAVDGSADFSGLEGCPVLLQSFIPKRHEWRITTVGDRVFAARSGGLFDLLLLSPGSIGRRSAPTMSWSAFSGKSSAVRTRWRRLFELKRVVCCSSMRLFAA